MKVKPVRPEPVEGSKGWKKPARLILVMVFFAGGGLFFDHIASYGWAFHLAWLDHGVAGLIMILASVAGALAIFKWRKGE